MHGQKIQCLSYAWFFCIFDSFDSFLGCEFILGFLVFANQQTFLKSIFLRNHIFLESFCQKNRAKHPQEITKNNQKR